MHHEQVNIVAFGSHDLDEVDGSEEHEAIETPDVGGEPSVIDISERQQQTEHGDDEYALDETLLDGFVAQGALHFELQVFAYLSETVEEGELRDVLQLGLLVAGDLLVDEVQLQTSVDDVEHCTQQETAGCRQPCEAVVFATADKQFRPFLHVDNGVAIDGKVEEGWQEPPPNLMVDECAHQQVPLAVGRDHQPQQGEHGQSAEQGQSAANADEDIGYEESHPDEVSCREDICDEKTVNDIALLDGQCDVGLDEHGRCLLHAEAHQEIERQQEGHDTEEQREIAATCSPAKHCSDEDEVEQGEANADIDEYLGNFVLFEHRMATLTQLEVPAQGKEEL